ncbi:hypothetical protein AALP_AA7G136700 [Arabis alpina]|uniref:Uncharacterized protein n=1 Tax=Arabis alpina TaxID=50452 RepID=A0A087GHV6_ARAAL|nr:hypothetical protein AALP_AA7G136700 [Arabis alpina]
MGRPSLNLDVYDVSAVPLTVSPTQAYDRRKKDKEAAETSKKRKEGRNLVWNKRIKARLILIFSTNTNRESVANKSFRPSNFDVRGVRKVTTGITGLW